MAHNGETAPRTAETRDALNVVKPLLTQGTDHQPEKHGAASQLQKLGVIGI
jgi:hypothetical protein